MVIDNSTLEILNYQTDVQFEFNIKITVLIILILYSLGMLIFNKYISEDRFYLVVIKYSMKIFSWMFLVLSLFFVVFLFREVSVFELLTLIVSLYHIILIITIILAHFSIFNFLLETIGMRRKRERNKLRYMKYG